MILIIDNATEILDPISITSNKPYRDKVTRMVDIVTHVQSSKLYTRCINGTKKIVNDISGLRKEDIIHATAIILVDGVINVSKIAKLANVPIVLWLNNDVDWMDSSLLDVIDRRPIQRYIFPSHALATKYVTQYSINPGMCRYVHDHFSGPPKIINSDKTFDCVFICYSTEAIEIASRIAIFSQSNIIISMCADVQSIEWIVKTNNSDEVLQNLSLDEIQEIAGKSKAIVNVDTDLIEYGLFMRLRHSGHRIVSIDCDVMREVCPDIEYIDIDRIPEVLNKSYKGSISSHNSSKYSSDVISLIT